MDRNFKSLSEALYAGTDYLTKLANKPSMRAYCQDIINATVDMNRAAFALEHPEEKTGHWVNAKVGKLFPSNDYKCSECGNLLNFDGVNCGRGDANYCPNCGCHMVEPHESEG